MRILLRPRAKQDLDEIWDYTAITWNPGQADVYSRQIATVFAALADSPHLGSAIDEVRIGYRKCRVGSHIVFYRVLDDAIEVVRVLHQRMDAGKHLSR